MLHLQCKLCRIFLELRGNSTRTQHRAAFATAGVLITEVSSNTYCLAKKIKNYIVIKTPPDYIANIMASLLSKASCTVTLLLSTQRSSVCGVGAFELQT